MVFAARASVHDASDHAEFVLPNERLSAAGDALLVAVVEENDVLAGRKRLSEPHRVRRAGAGSAEVTDGDQEV
jgi:hypothetical protein